MVGLPTKPTQSFGLACPIKKKFREAALGDKISETHQVDEFREAPLWR